MKVKCVIYIILNLLIASNAGYCHLQVCYVLRTELVFVYEKCLCTCEK